MCSQLATKLAADFQGGVLLAISAEAISGFARSISGFARKAMGGQKKFDP